MSASKPHDGAGTPRWAKYDKANNLWGTMFRLFRYIGKYRYWIYLGIIISFATSLVTLVAPQYLKELTDTISAGIGESATMDMDAVTRYVLILAGLYLLTAIMRSISSILTPSASEYNGNVMRKDMARKLSRIPLGYLDKLRTGDIMSRFTNDTGSIRNQSASSISNMITAITMIVGSLVMMLYTEWHLALIAIVPAIIGFFLTLTIVRRSQKYFVRQSQDLGKINTLVEETYYGIDIVNAYNGRKDVRDEFIEVNNDLYSSALKSRFLTSLMPQTMGFISNISYVIVCVVGSILILDGYMGYGSIVAFIIYVKEFSDPLERLSNSISNMQSVAASAERVFEFLDAPELSNEDDKADMPAKVEGRVEFKDVHFSYEPGKEIIHGLNLTVEPGQKIAIVGPTGSGKTTIANLLMRFYETDSGDIVVDGISLRDIKRSQVHEMFCMVLQDTWLFNGTIKENITFNRTDVSDEELRTACEAVGIDAYIRSLPDGYDTVLNDADSLSAGQRQQLTIARALVRDAPLLILDEATSSVDTRTEKRIQNAMDSLMKGRTSFVIAHRLSTIKDADLILVVKKGSVIESGTHQQLLAKNGFYKELYDSQFEHCE
ncbi:MAG: ABC transporter ATP-binding protein [Candidatus Methanomethylophilaceae archaeon]|jgi:ATP-binding cassette subfamily B protein|nr:ABC transporter ATP-binding protein [Candidatus Methanomethylophilaceae archaeon]MBR3477461.1 ABC transporter ATP-binding protein [Candidatus Methanomethylophilaceae archaeon]